MSKNVPEIRIQYTWLLDDVSKILEKEYNKGDTGKSGTYEQCEEWAAAYRKEWKKHAEKILTGMQECTGLTFKRNIIDVSLAQWFRPVSNPLIINFRPEPDEFVDVLTHELFHVLFTDNTIISSRNGNDSKSKVNLRKLYGEKPSFSTLVHIPVHAGSKYIYLDVLKQPYRLQRDIDYISKYNDYKKAWDYVEQHGYKKILQELNEYYQSLNQ